jgi:hypothetical protein
MKDNLKKIENGGQPQFFENQRLPTFLDNGRRPQFFDNKIQTQFFENGRRPHFLKMEDDLKKYRNAEYKAADIWHSRYDFLISCLTLKVPMAIDLAETKLNPVKYMHRW